MGISYIIIFGNIVDNLNGNEVIDEVLCMWFLGINNFVGEDIVEINCYGGVVIINSILELLLVNGVRLVEFGEFSRRSFLNGKMDFIKVEVINDLIYVSIVS